MVNLTFQSVALAVVAISGGVAARRAASSKERGLRNLIPAAAPYAESPDAPLYGLLSAIQLPALRKIVHMVYVGRGDSAYTAEDADELRGIGRTAEVLTGVLMGKPLAEYLTAAIDIARREGVDLEADVLVAGGILVA